QPSIVKLCRVAIKDRYQKVKTKKATAQHSKTICFASLPSEAGSAASLRCWQGRVAPYPSGEAQRSLPKGKNSKATAQHNKVMPQRSRQQSCVGLRRPPFGEKQPACVAGRVGSLSTNVCAQRSTTSCASW